MSVNKAFLVGRLGAAPEMKTTQGGKAMCQFSVATDGWGGEDKGRTTEWHSIVVWERQAQLCEQYLNKGSLVAVEGRLATRSWDDPKSGVKRYKTEVVASRVTFLGGRGEATTHPSGGHDGGPGAGRRGGAVGVAHAGREVRDDLPF